MASLLFNQIQCPNACLSCDASYTWMKSRYRLLTSDLLISDTPFGTSEHTRRSPPPSRKELRTTMSPQAQYLPQELGIHAPISRCSPLFVFPPWVARVSRTNLLEAAFDPLDLLQETTCSTRPGHYSPLLLWSSVNLPLSDQPNPAFLNYKLIF